MECGEGCNGCLPSFYFLPGSRNGEVSILTVGAERGLPPVFGRQWDMDGDLCGTVRTGCFKDCVARKVSDNYFDSNLELPVEGMDGNYVYVGLFSAYGWRGIDFTKVESGKALFRNLASRQVYILLAFANGQYRPIGNPFILMARIYILMLQIPPSAILLNCIGNTLFRNVSGIIWEG